VRRYDPAHSLASEWRSAGLHPRRCVSLLQVLGPVLVRLFVRKSLLLQLRRRRFLSRGKTHLHQVVITCTVYRSRDDKLNAAPQRRLFDVVANCAVLLLDHIQYIHS